MSDEPPKKPDEPETSSETSEEKRLRHKALMKGLIRIAKEAAAASGDEEYEIHVTPENKYGTPYPEGSEMDFKAKRELFCSRPASLRVQ
ncbi:MAG: hypothetical protein WCC92_06990 [Candidatus Korobacteraceae bacterium]